MAARDYYYTNSYAVWLLACYRHTSAVAMAAAMDFNNVNGLIDSGISEECFCKTKTRACQRGTKLK